MISISVVCTRCLQSWKASHPGARSTEENLLWRHIFVRLNFRFVTRRLELKCHCAFGIWASLYDWKLKHNHYTILGHSGWTRKKNVARTLLLLCVSQMLDSAAVFNAEYGLLYSSKLREHAQILWAAIHWRLLSLAQNILKSWIDETEIKCNKMAIVVSRFLPYILFSNFKCLFCSLVNQIDIVRKTWKSITWGKSSYMSEINEMSLGTAENAPSLRKSRNFNDS